MMAPSNSRLSSKRQRGGRRVRLFGLIAFRLQQEAEGFENIGLIIGDQDTRGGHEYDPGERNQFTIQPSARLMVRFPYSAFRSECVT